MLHKLGYTIGKCENCGLQIHEDEQYDGENELCERCVDEWQSEQIAHYLPRSRRLRKQSPILNGRTKTNEQTS